AECWLPGFGQSRKAGVERWETGTGSSVHAPTEVVETTAWLSGFGQSSHAPFARPVSTSFSLPSVSASRSEYALQMFNRFALIGILVLAPALTAQQCEQL